MFKTTAEILNLPWREKLPAQIIPPELLPLRKDWKYQRDLLIDDVELWEEIYYQPGTIGIYAAWNPYAEFYIVVYNLFAKELAGIKTFQGQGAYKEVMHHAEKLGVSLELDKIWVDKDDEWLYDF